MLELFRSKSHSILGVDIASNSVKILEISVHGQQYCVQGYAQIGLPENALDGTEIKEIDLVAECIQQIVSSTAFSCKKVALAVPDSSTISRVLQVNEGLSEDEVEEIVIMEADKYLPYSIDEINLDFEILGPSAKNSAVLDVLLVASKAENVNTRVEAVLRAGLEAKVVDIESFAIERTAALLVPTLLTDGSNKIVAMIDIGDHYTHFYILHGLKTIFSHEEEFGNDQLLGLIQQRYGLSMEEAVNAFDQNTLPEDFQTAVLNPFLELILLQVKRGLQFFFSSGQYTRVDAIFLAGKVGKYTEIATLTQDNTNIPTRIANPFQTMSLSKSVVREQLMADAPELLIACGLALRAI